MHRKRLFIYLALLGVALFLAACGGATTECPECPEAECPEGECPEVVPPEPGIDVPFEELWATSGHADASAEAFRHWDEDDPPVVAASCAKCHSSYGYLDFLGVDGTEAGVVDNDAPTDSVITCVTCHNAVTETKDSVVMPSGMEITGLGPEARCMECHQGRESAISVNTSIEEVGVEDDVVSEDLGFLNIHYYAAAATKYGTLAQGGYEYEGKSYDGNFAHTEEYDTCVECHSPHTLELRVEECSVCHNGVASAEDLKDVRMAGSLVDYDGDGSVEEGIFFELQGLQEKLYQAIQAYASEVVGMAVAYDSHAYPYFFNDSNADGVAGEDEAAYPNRYVSWTPRLLKAAYNYQVSFKDPGAFAHGGKYIIQLLYDSIEDLNTALSTPVDMTGMNRIDDGHFAGSEEAFRHWDEDGFVEYECSRCHSATGLPLWISVEAEINQPLSNGFTCETCHDDLVDFTRYEVAEVTFPSGATLDSGDPNTNLCMNCHQGRSSTVTINEIIAEAHPLNEEGEADETKIAGMDEVSDLATRDANPHYFAAGATLFGTQVQGGYQYEGKTYVGRNLHVEPYSNCTQCHTTHGLDVKVAQCGACHQGVASEEDLHSIRIDETDYDGDGDTTEGIAGEIDTMREVLLAAMQQYALDNEMDAIIYGQGYPYWFIDSNANGVADPGEAIYPNQYIKWTPRLFMAAYNYNYSTKDPGAFAHNAKYIIQLLYDSIEDLGGSVAGMTRP